MDRVIKEQVQHTPFASHVETNYYFSKDPELKKRYVRRDGSSLRYGKIIEELDALAGDCSYKYLLESLDPKHFNPETRPYFLVTVSVDRIDFVGKLNSEKDMRMSAYMMMAKGSTLMVKIDVLQKGPDEKDWQ
jgi:acyl-coenzyme A thioesterase 9